MVTMESPRNRLFCFGYGGSAQALAARLLPWGEWEITGTSRDGRDIGGIQTIAFDGSAPSAEVARQLAAATHLLISIPPNKEGDPALRRHAEDIASAGSLRWIGYLSTTGVYGDHDGGWVDETTPCRPTSERARRRLCAETAWLEQGKAQGVATHVFRLAGIYGPGRNPLRKLREGRAQRIRKPGQVFSRIHLADIATVLEASIHRPRSGALYNLCDDDPVPPGEVIAFAAELLGLAPPPEVAWEEAGLSEMAKSFYQDNKRVKNQLIKDELSIRLAYPSYREGLRACLALGE